MPRLWRTRPAKFHSGVVSGDGGRNPKLGPYEIQSPLGAGGPEGSCYCSRGMRIT